MDMIQQPRKSIWREKHIAKLLWITIVAIALIGIICENTFNPDPSENTSTIFISTFLLFRLMYVAYFFQNCYFQPEFLPSSALVGLCDYCARDLDSNLFSMALFLGKSCSSSKVDSKDIEIYANRRNGLTAGLWAV